LHNTFLYSDINTILYVYVQTLARERTKQSLEIKTNVTILEEKNSFDYLTTKSIKNSSWIRFNKLLCENLITTTWLIERRV